MNKSEYYQPARQYKPEKIRCSQCQRQLGKEVFTCKERPFSCPYEEYEFKSYNWTLFMGHLIVGFLFGYIGLTLLVQLIDGFLSISTGLTGLMVFLCLAGIVALFMMLTLFIAFIALKEALTRLLTGFNQKGLLNPKTGEKWQRTSAETSYRPVAFMPDSVENPPKLSRSLSYPASSIALYDQKVYAAWQAGGTDYGTDQIGYVMLATLLHLVSMGYLEIWFAPLYASTAWDKTLSRTPYHDFWFILTRLGESTKFAGKLEQKIKETIKWQVNSSQNYHKWVPGASLMTILSVFNINDGSHEDDDLQTQMHKKRRAAMLWLLRNASKMDTVLRKQGGYYPNSELEPLLRREAEILAQLVQTYYETDPQFIAFLWQQITGYLDQGFYEELGKWLLKRESS